MSCRQRRSWSTICGWICWEWAGFSSFCAKVANASGSDAWAPFFWGCPPALAAAPRRSQQLSRTSISSEWIAERKPNALVLLEWGDRGVGSGGRCWQLSREHHWLHLGRARPSMSPDIHAIIPEASAALLKPSYLFVRHVAVDRGRYDMLFTSSGLTFGGKTPPWTEIATTVESLES